MYKPRYPIIIIGGGIAAVSCAESLPFWLPNQPFLLISACPIIKTVSNAINLTQTLIKFNVEQHNTNWLTEKYTNLDVLIDTVIKINSEKKIVYTELDLSFEYDKLCICTGGRPKLIFPENPNVLGIRDTDSVKEFRDRLAHAQRVMIVGNGGIATELVYEIKNVEIIWVIKDRHISSAFVDAGAAEFLKDALIEPVTDINSGPEAETSFEVSNSELIKDSTPIPNDHTTANVGTRFKAEKTEGCTFTIKKNVNSPIIRRIKYHSEEGSKAALGPDWHSHFNFTGKTNHLLQIEYEAQISEIIQKPNYLEIKLDNGKTYNCDFILSATGVIPNGNAIKTDPIDFDLSDDAGINVDEFLKTNIPDIFAAGDVVHANWTLAPQWHQMRLWTQARQMGQYAAKVMAAEIKDEQTLPDFAFELFSHVTSFFGFKVILLGLYNGQRLDDYELLLRVTKGKEFVKLVLQNGRLQGAILIGDTDLEEMCENLILNKIDLTPFGEHLLDPDIDIDDYFD